jgi:glutathione synthase/RimK-type ligase-like ATP-grasp enzyme
MILCLGLAADPTFIHTLRALRRARVNFDVVDIAQLAHSGTIEGTLLNPLNTTIKLHAASYTLGLYSGIFSRLVNVSDGAPSERLRHRAEGIYHALGRLLSDCGLSTINPPIRDNSNFTKLFHAVALAYGAKWRIPRSCLTNDPEEALKFIEECDGNVIFKGASGVKTWATKYDRSLHHERLSWLPRSPVLFQECIVGEDVRVHVVGSRTFAEGIESPQIDYRYSRNNRYRQVETPSDISTGCARLVSEMRLPFLGVDFKVASRSGIWYFLEANSLPCYEGYDRRAGGRISGAIVEWLNSPDTCC